MPGAKKQYRKKRPAIKRRPRANPRLANQTSGALSNVKHYARITETALFTPIAPNVDYNYSFSLSLFDRAQAVSKNFKFYRPKRVVWTYLPDFNTFQSGGTVSLPQVSMIMNRTGDSTAWTPAEYDAQGAVPKQFSKKMVIAYNPNIVQSIQYITIGGPLPFTGNLGVRPVYNEWIATGTYSSLVANPAGGVASITNDNLQMLFQGHSMYWNVSTPGSISVLGSVYCEVEWEFKDPLFTAPASQAIPATPVPSA